MTLLSGRLPPTTAIADVGLLAGIRCWLTPPLAAMTTIGGSVAGRAMTVELGAGAPSRPGAFEPMYRLLDSDLKGSVVLVAGAAGIDGAVWGQILSRAAHRSGAVAVAVEGAVRDRSTLASEGLGVWAIRELCVGPAGMAHVRSVGRAVRVADVTVAPGDVVVGDEAGLVSLPGALAPRIVELAERYAAAEDRVLHDLSNGRPLMEAYGHKRRAVSDVLDASLAGPEPVD